VFRTDCVSRRKNVTLEVVSPALVDYLVNHLCADPLMCVIAQDDVPRRFCASAGLSPGVPARGPSLGLGFIARCCVFWGRQRRGKSPNLPLIFFGRFSLKIRGGFFGADARCWAI